MFLYHYLNALAFLILALAYAVYRLWQERSSAIGALGLSVVVGLTFALAKIILTRLDVGSAVAVIYAVAIGLAMLALAYGAQRTWQQPWGRIGAVAFLAVVALIFVYFYPHLAAVPVSGKLDHSYYWFSSWQ
jgi:dolichyl-phosphate-mannose--protein O-mannosyl transferase